MLKIKVLCLVLCLIVNVFSISYAEQNVSNAFKMQNKYTYSKKIRIIKSDDFDKSFKELLEEGYISIKSEVFKENTGDYDYKKVVERMNDNAKKIRAELILFSSENQGSSIFQSKTVHAIPRMAGSNKSNNVFNNSLNQDNMDGTYMGAFTRTSSTTKYNVNYLIFFNSRMGIYPVNLSDIDKSNNGLQTGVKAMFIKKNTPADGQIQENDIIIKIGNDDIMNVNSFVESSNSLKSGFITLQILRKGQKMNKIIAIN